MFHWLLLLISLASCDEFVISDSSYGKVGCLTSTIILTILSLLDRCEAATRVQGWLRLHHKGGRGAESPHPQQHQGWTWR